MKTYYPNTRKCFDKYDEIIDKIYSSIDETPEEDDEFIQNFALYLAHALIKDHGFGQRSREELIRVADIIKAFGI